MKRKKQKSPTAHVAGFAKKQPLAFPAKDAASSARGSLLHAWNKAEQVYGHLPKLPFLDKDTSAILLISLLVYAIFTAGVFLTSTSEPLHAILTEGQLSKNTPLALLSGERYSYEISAAGKTERLQYDVLQSSSCKGLLVIESAREGQQNTACLTRSGNLEGDQFQLNFSLGNRSMLLFSPWMLAASDNFNWQVQTTISTGTANINMPINFKSYGTKQMAGRKAYEILMQSEFSPPLKYYIDSEKRVLLFIDFGNASARLVSAPFPLNWANSSITMRQ